jgi:hypothetical protein
LNLPVVPITDLVVKANDLVVATQGRGFWILDDLTPLHEYGDAVTRARFHVFKPLPAVRLAGAAGFEEGAEGPAPPVGKNPANGVVVNYWLKEKPSAKEVLTVEFLDGEEVLRKFTSEKKEKK